MVLAFHAYSKAMRFSSHGKKNIYNNIVERYDSSIELHTEFLNVQCLV